MNRKHSTILHRLLRVMLMIFTVTLFGWSEGHVPGMMLLASLLLLSSLYVNAAAFLIAFSFPWRFDISIPFIDYLVQIGETGYYYPFCLLLGTALILFLPTGRLLCREIRAQHLKPFIVSVLIWCRRFCLAGVFFHGVTDAVPVLPASTKYRLDAHTLRVWPGIIRHPEKGHRKNTRVPVFFPLPCCC